MIDRPRRRLREMLSSYSRGESRAAYAAADGKSASHPRDSAGHQRRPHPDEYFRVVQPQPFDARASTRFGGTGEFHWRSRRSETTADGGTSRVIVSRPDKNGPRQFETGNRRRRHRIRTAPTKPSASADSKPSKTRRQRSTASYRRDEHSSKYRTRLSDGTPVKSRGRVIAGFASPAAGERLPAPRTTPTRSEISNRHADLPRRSSRAVQEVLEAWRGRG